MTLIPVRKKEQGRGEVARLHDEMNNFIKSLQEPWERPLWGGSHVPAIDIAEQANEFMVKMEVPGCKAEDVDISVHGNILTISGEKKQEEESDEKGYYYTERSYGSFRRDLTLAKDGVLTITVPKTEKAKPVKVKVKGQ
jgi:HSP20 family protein